MQGIEIAADGLGRDQRDGVGESLSLFLLIEKEGLD
jgi:hypothetical protein